MLKNKELRKLFSLVLSFIIVFGSFSTFVHADNNNLTSVKVDLDELASSKIMPELMKDMDSEDLIEVLVYLSDQVDTEIVANNIKSSVSSATTPYQTKLQVKRGVVEALKDNSEMTQMNMINYLEQEIEKGNVEEFIPYHIVNMVYVKATKEVIKNISFMNEVEKIYKNKTHMQEVPEMEKEIVPSVDGIEWNIERVRANETWDLGYDGTGIVVANIDSGVQWDHPALKHKWRGYDPSTGETNPNGNWFDPVYGATLPADSDAHGTHVMGTMVGQEPDGSNKIGVAPGAKWIAARVFNTAGSTTDSILLSAAQWMLAPGGNPEAAPDVVNNSWGGGNGIDDWYREAVINWRAAGIVPVFSAGNQRAGEPAPWPGSISVPSNYPESFAVAAIDRNDMRGSFSKLGPSPYDESIIKPDISGPGVNVRSSVPGGYEGGWSGTSMSAPAVSGAVALLLSANSSLTVDEIEEMLKDTADPLTDSTYPEAPNMGYGYGMVDTFESVSLVASGTGSVSGRVLVPGEDSEDPEVIHEQEIFETYPDTSIEIFAEISDDVSITEVELLVKAEGTSYWMQAPMNLVSGDYKDGRYKGTITSDMLKGNSVLYKIKVRDFAGEVVVTENYKIDIIFTAGELKYDDGTAENALVLNGVGNGLAVRFTPAELASLKSARVYLWDNSFPTPGGNEIGIVIYDSNQEQVGEPIYVDNLVRGDWNLIDLSSIDFSTSDDFYISTMQNEIGDYSPAVGLDDDSGLEYSRSYINIGGELSPLADEGPDYQASLMIRAIVDYEIEGNSYNGQILKPNTIRKESKVKVNEDMLKLMSDNMDINKADYVKSAYSMISDAEVENMPMIFVGIPVKDAVVTVLETGRSIKVDPITGKYFLRGALGEYTLRAEAYGYRSKDIVVNIEEDKTSKANFVLEPRPQGTIEGSVVDRYDGAPAAYATVRVAEDPKIASVTADENGHFTMEGVYEGTYTLKVVADGFEPGQATVTVVQNETAEVSIELKRFVGYEDEIIYDDGTGENALVLNSAGYGLAVRFTPEEFGKIKGTNVFFWGHDWPVPGGDRIGFAIYDENQKQVGDPIFQDVVRGEWNYIDLSEFGFATDEDFYISTIQQGPGTENPGTGIDEDSPHGDRSYMNLDGEFKLISAENIEGGLMIRARMEYAMDIPTITNPQSETYTNQDTIRVEGKSTADGRINVYVNDEKVTSVETENREFTVEVDLTEERNEIRVTAEMDGKETEPSEAVIVTKDKVAPVLTVEKPLDNAKIKVESVNVIGNATDDIKLAKVEINDKEVDVNEDGNFNKRLLLDPGENIITVKATDGAGNETIVTRTVHVNLEDPVITNVKPDEDMDLRVGEVLTVSFNAESGGEGYFRLMAPFGLQSNEIGIPMTEVDGLYSGTWTVPEEIGAEDVLIEVVYINEYGYEVTKIAEGKVNIVSEDNPVPPVKEITNMKPDVDSTLRAGETVQMSFNAPRGGNGYYRIVLPFELNGNNPGNPMVEGTEGFYSATWKVPEGIAASNLLVEFVFEDANGTKMYDMAPGRLTIIGQMENLSPNSIIIGNEAFDMDYLNNNSYAQRKLLQWSNSGKEIFLKLNNQMIVTADGQKVTINELPSELTHFDTDGNTTYFQK